MAGIGGMNHISILDPGGRLLHDPLQNSLRPCAMDLDVESRILRLESMGNCRRGGKRQRGIPGHRSLFSRRLNHRGVLGEGSTGGDNRKCEQQKVETLSHVHTSS